MMLTKSRVPSLNYVLIAGNVTKNPVFRHTTNGTPVTNFTIASNRKFCDNTGQWREEVCYIGVVAWYKLAEKCSTALKKGSRVIVDGELQSRNKKTENGYYRNIVEINAQRIQLLQSKGTFDEFTDNEEPLETSLESDELEEEIPERKVENCQEAAKQEPAIQESTQQNTTMQEPEQQDSTKAENEESLKETNEKPNENYDFGYNQLKL